MRFPTNRDDHAALQREINAEIAAGERPDGILTWMIAHGSGWLETGRVIREGDYADFAAEPAMNRASVRIQDRLEVVSPARPYDWLAAEQPRLGARPLDLLRQGEAESVLTLLDELAVDSPGDPEVREREAIIEIAREMEARYGSAQRKPPNA